MKASLAACLLLGLAIPVFAADPTIAEARLRLLSGNYEEAKELYTELAKAAPTKVKATIGLSRALEAVGEYDRALAAVESLLKTVPKDADLLGREAELLYQRGRWEEAEKAADAAIAANKDRTHFSCAGFGPKIFRDRGELAKAEEEYRWFVKAYNVREAKDDPVKDPDDLLFIALAAIENSRGKKELASEFKDVLDDLLGDALKNEKKFWPAEYTAGMLLLEKFNRGDALDAFDKALVINPDAAEALVGKGERSSNASRAMWQWSSPIVGEKINPRLPEALRLKADVYFSGGEYDAARKELDKAKLINCATNKRWPASPPASRFKAKRRSSTKRPRAWNRLIVSQQLFGSSSASNSKAEKTTPTPRHATRRPSTCDPCRPVRNATSACSTWRMGREKKPPCCSIKDSKPIRSMCASAISGKCSTISRNTRRSKRNTSCCAIPRTIPSSLITWRSNWNRFGTIWLRNSSISPISPFSSRCSRRTPCSAAEPWPCRTSTRSEPAPAECSPWSRPMVKEFASHSTGGASET